MEGGCNEMKIEIMIYTYIAICVSMILYNIIYVFILKHRERALISDSKKMAVKYPKNIKNIFFVNLIKHQELLLLIKHWKVYLKKSLF